VVARSRRRWFEGWRDDEFIGSENLSSGASSLDVLQGEQQASLKLKRARPGFLQQKHVSAMHGVHDAETAHMIRIMKVELVAPFSSSRGRFQDI
jgi:hypothetical protein